ncbi:RNA-binding protein [Vairimorpha necatrix]|uniref:RNA-binding protein n=1 Tax=Vairimorpha necatrix TaxID=6039 RepID=A0AAX4JEX9_9MICR
MRKTNNLAISNLTDKVSVKQIADAFSKYEFKITSINIKEVYRRDGGKKLVGNVEFKDTESIEEVVASEKISINNEEYPVYFAKGQSSKEKVIISDKKLYIKGLPKDLQESEIIDMLGKCKISTTNQGSHIVFAEFESSGEQQAALDKLENMEIKGRQVRARKALEKVFPPKGKFRREKGGDQ